jgi:hypothetical protein
LAAGRRKLRRRWQQIDISNERELVWLDAPERHRYVRAATFISRSNFDAPPTPRDGSRIVAFARVEHDDRRDTYRRRMFVLRPGDCWPWPGCPAEAVDPLTIEIGVQGRRTPRAAKFEPIFVDGRP